MCRHFAVCLYILLISVATSLAKYRKPIIKYPKDTQFWATDFFVRGCRNFLEKCPSSYKAQMICARNYNGDYKDFSNYCEMQYENCNTWKVSNPTRNNSFLKLLLRVVLKRRDW
ncbi:uncharacterized protein LOC113514506 isoform X1 [Galleria mellonella]|uniref:Uncharacterized protein LOC113514506 isoform X1 n=1 Tax=Galleria mellonella TaxID=7137 RepID=A0ABM3MNV1_GALME|nr:uncharacterized protein LOC113514506 isoform X1 [Galleria mellonella]